MTVQVVASTVNAPVGDGRSLPALPAGGDGSLAQRLAEQDEGHYGQHDEGAGELVHMADMVAHTPECSDAVGVSWARAARR